MSGLVVAITVVALWAHSLEAQSCQRLLPVELLNGCTFDALAITLPSNGFSITRESCNELVDKSVFQEQPYVTFSNANEVEQTRLPYIAFKRIVIVELSCFAGQNLFGDDDRSGCTESSGWRFRCALDCGECSGKMTNILSKWFETFSRSPLFQGYVLKQGLGYDVGDTVIGSGNNIYN